MSNPKKKYTTLGVMTKAKKRNEDDPDEAPRYYIKLKQQQNKKTGKIYGEQIFPITLANGTVLKDGDILAMFSKKEEFKKMAEEGKLEPTTAEEMASYLLFDIKVVESVDQGERDDSEVKF